ncbi:MAG: hypothetical protein EXR73_14220 [Myxococcales bacterium]|nr:hypothetical protein [Myxococcales bacterium]
MLTRAREATAPRVALACDDERTAREVARVAGVRGFRFEELGLEAAIDAPVGSVAYAPAEPPSPETALRLAPLCQRAAENRRPVVLLAAVGRTRGRAAEEQIAAAAILRTHGAVVLECPDAWFETAVFLAVHGIPSGSRVAVIAPDGGWLHLAATALALEDEARGATRSHAVLAEEPAEPHPTDIALVDAEFAAVASERAGRALFVPVVARAELLSGDSRPALVGLRAALAAAHAAGRLGERVRQGLGPAPPSDVKRWKVDRERVDRLLALGVPRLGDHESKLLLAAYGVPVTRQSVAMTPSRAVQIARTCGWPVEVKPYDPELPVERDGGTVITGAKNPPEVRRAFAAASSSAGVAVGQPVIVRATPSPGRNVVARIERHAVLGWTVQVTVPGAPRPLAAPAPLRKTDAEDLAAALESSRAGDTPPDRAALADLLHRASHVAVDREAEVESIDLARVIVAARGDGALVADVRIRLARRRAR